MIAIFMKIMKILTVFQLLFHYIHFNFVPVLVIQTGISRSSFPGCQIYPFYMLSCVSSRPLLCQNEFCTMESISEFFCFLLDTSANVSKSFLVLLLLLLLLLFLFQLATNRCCKTKGVKWRNSEFLPKLLLAIGLCILDF